MWNELDKNGVHDTLWQRYAADAERWVKFADEAGMSEAQKAVGLDGITASYRLKSVGLF